MTRDLRYSFFAFALMLAPQVVWAQSSLDGQILDDSGVAAPTTKRLLTLSGNEGVIRAAARGNDGAVYAAGALGAGGFVAKLDALGEADGWRELSGAANGVTVDDKGAVWVAGDGFFHKLDAGLNPLYDVPVVGAASAVAARPGGTVLLAQGSRLITYSPAGIPLGELDLGTGTAISAIALSPSGEGFLTGSSRSAWLPSASDTLRGPSDAFVTKLAADGASAEWSVHVGGSDTDEGAAVVAIPGGGVILLGYTRSSDFPGAEPTPSLAGERQGFIAFLDPQGRLVQSAMARIVGEDRIAGEEGLAGNTQRSSKKGTTVRQASSVPLQADGSPEVVLLPWVLTGATTVTPQPVPPPSAGCNCTSTFGSLLGGGFKEVIAVAAASAASIGWVTFVVTAAEWLSAIIWL